MTTPNTTARKKNSVKRQRNLVLRVRVLPSEPNEIRKRAAALGVSLSEVLRESALDAPDRPLRKRIPNPARRLGLRASDFRQAMGDLDSSWLPTVDAARAQIKKMSKAESELDESGRPTLLLQSDGMSVQERSPGHLGGPR